ncbi:MAG: ribosome maturation factor RimP [Firmicutes bacterium]|nr:ribosome maturation factor RimP [Bacillota bacterium]
MNYIKVKERAENEITPIIEGAGYEVVEVKCARVGSDNALTFHIWKKGGITLNDCEAVNNLIDSPLDSLDISDGAPYTLNISSPGLDRAIISNDDYRRNLDLELEAHFITQVDKKKKLSGILKSYNETSFTLETKGKEVTLERANVRSLKQVIKFK